MRQQRGIAGVFPNAISTTIKRTERPPCPWSRIYPWLRPPGEYTPVEVVMSVELAGNLVKTSAWRLATSSRCVATRSGDLVTHETRVRTQHKKDNTKRIINFAFMLLCMTGSSESMHLLVLNLHGTYVHKSYVVVLTDCWHIADTLLTL
jgi:hypothetical protein